MQATDGGGIYNTGVLSLTNATVSSNSASRNGGGIYNDGSLTLINSTVSGNTAMVGDGAVYHTLGSPVSVTGSTLSDNSGRPGGSIFNAGGRVDVINSTISGNRSVGGNGGGIHNSSGEVELTNVTVTGNSAPGNGGGGVYDGDQVALVATIIAGNTAGSAPDCLGTLSSLGFNLIRNPSGCSGIGLFDLLNTNPLLRVLQNNGGPPSHTPCSTVAPRLTPSCSAETERATQRLA